MEAYPLAWPDGWPRTLPAHRKDGRYHFKRGENRPWTFAAARGALYEELGRMGAGRLVVSSNFPLNQSGEPAGNRGRPFDEGIAIYFVRRGKPYVMACDQWMGAEANMRSLALSIAALRTLERHGGGVMLERAFTGFAALPSPKTCWEILGLTPRASFAEVQAAWRKRIAGSHPDQGGSEAAAAEINAARDQALRDLQRRAG